MKRQLIKIVLCLFLFTPLFAQKPDLSIGLEAYMRGDWASAVLFFRKASSPITSTGDEALYWLVMSEISAQLYDDALKGCDVFISRFSNSSHYADIVYQRGRVLHELQRREESISQLTIFYESYPNNSLAPSALYWIAESLYDMGYFSESLNLFTQVVAEYPDSSKEEASLYKIALIEQRARELELLRLLKETHEESLALAYELARQQLSYEHTTSIYERRLENVAQDTDFTDLETEVVHLKEENALLRRRLQEMEAYVATPDGQKSNMPINVNSGVVIDSSSEILEQIRVLEEKAQIIQKRLTEEPTIGAE